MKQITIIVSILLLSLVAVAQNKKVAVMETKITDGVTAFQSNMVRGGMEVAVANAKGYEGYDRAAFDVIMKEQNFQRSGAVDETQITKIGQMAGVQYVLATEASSEEGFFYILAKLLDVETGRFVKSVDKLCQSTPAEIKSTCAEIGLQLLSSNTVDNAQIQGAKSNTNHIENHGLSKSRLEDVITINVGDVNFEMIKVSVDASCETTNNEIIKLRPKLVDDYYIGIFEVTQEVWEAVMGKNPSHFKGSNLPVECVGINTIKSEFLPKLKELTGNSFRLPTEDEWEFAARGGNKSKGYEFSGSNVADEVAWYNGNSGNHTHAVGELRPNELGIYDMIGNVMEWCNDNIVRGGSFRSNRYQYKITSRSLRSFGTRDLGFRLVYVP